MDIKARIDLAHATMFQETTSTGKTDWKIRKNISNEELFIFPKYISDKDMFLIMEFARKFELIAFNAGADYQRELSKQVLDKTQADFSNRIKVAREENERLSLKLMKLIGDEDDL